MKNIVHSIMLKYRLKGHEVKVTSSGDPEELAKQVADYIAYIIERELSVTVFAYFIGKVRHEVTRGSYSPEQLVTTIAKQVRDHNTEANRLQKEYDDYWERLHEKELAQWLTEREEEEKNKGYTSY